MKIALRTLLCLGLFALASTARTQPKSKVVEDVWEVALWTDAKGKDQKFGYSRFQVVELEQNGVKHLRARRELQLTVARGSDEATIRAEMGSDETLDGKVIGVYGKIWPSPTETITINGQLKDKEMHLTIQGGKPPERMIPWPSETVGLVKELALLREKKVRTGDEFEYSQFQPTMSKILKVAVKVGPEEEVKLPTGTRKLLRVVAMPEKIVLPDTKQEIQLPPSIQWVDPSNYTPSITLTELPGIGTFKLLRVDKQAALAPNGTLPNLFEEQSISVTRVPQINSVTAVTYRITLTGKGADTKGLLKEDARQNVEKIDGQTITLHVESIRAPRKMDKPEKVGKEYLDSNHFIDCDSKQVREHAKAAVAGETDPWKKAQRIERWVRSNMRPLDFTTALATSAIVAKTLSGDCTEYAMLTAAMCRAEGIPSQTAIGLVYVEDRKRGPILGFHMWTEVFVEGQWLGLDATIGEGSIGPGHLKITDHHWDKVDAFNPLLPITGFMLTKPKIEVVQVRRKN